MRIIPTSIKSKITLIVVLVTFIITISFASVCFFMFHSLLQKSLIQSTEFGLQVSAHSISEQMDNITFLSDWTNNNTLLTNYLSSNPVLQKNLTLEAYNRLKEEYLNNKSTEYITRILIGNQESHFIQVVRNVNEGSSSDYFNVVTLPYYNTLYRAPGFEWIGILFDPMISDNKSQIIPIIRPIQSSHSSDIIGFIYLSISASLITDILKSYSIPVDSNIFLTINNKSYKLEDNRLVRVLTDYTILKEESNLTVNEAVKVSVIRNSSGKKETIVSYPCALDGWYVSQSLSQTQFSQQKYTYYLLLLFICIVCFSLGLFFAFYLGRIINTPIEKIRKKLNDISNGDFSYDPAIEWEHELGNIGKGVNVLSENIVMLMDKRISYEKQKKELEYQILQSQINPHFLYNTLNSIKWMATIQNATGIAEMTTALSRLLKSISKGTKQIISIDEELDLLNNYVLIQKYRYGGVINVEYDIETSEIKECLIPKFTLQPIVENAIFHGIEPKGENGLIKLTIKKQAENILIEIRDNGIGMSPELIKKVLLGSNENETSDFFKQIGIYNVDRRIKYRFGEQYGIDIKSELGHFTIMTILIPYMKASEKND